MRVRNNTDRIRTITIGNHKQISFMPGVNVTEGRHDAEMAKAGGFKKWVEAGYLTVLGDNDTPGKARKVPEVIAEINDMDDVPSIERIKERDQRPAVQKAAQARIDLLMQSPEGDGDQ